MVLAKAFNFNFTTIGFLLQFFLSLSRNSQVHTNIWNVICKHIFENERKKKRIQIFTPFFSSTQLISVCCIFSKIKDVCVNRLIWITLSRKIALSFRLAIELANAKRKCHHLKPHLNRRRSHNSITFLLLFSFLLILDYSIQYAYKHILYDSLAQRYQLRWIANWNFHLYFEMKWFVVHSIYLIEFFLFSCHSLHLELANVLSCKWF